MSAVLQNITNKASGSGKKKKGPAKALEVVPTASKDSSALPSPKPANGQAAGDDNGDAEHIREISK
jgi:hypothetical protein